MSVDRDELRRLAEAATPGPWYEPYECEGQLWYGATAAEVERVCLGLAAGTVTEVEGEEVFEQTHSLAYGDFEHQHDVEFIAAARTAVPELLDIVEGVRVLATRLADEPHECLTDRGGTGCHECWRDEILQLIDGATS